jgi:uncharacterized protein
MELHLESVHNNNAIKSITANGIDIGAHRIRQSVILTFDAIYMWDVSHVDQLNEDHFGLLSQYATGTVILGTGKETVFIDPSLTKPLIARGIGVETMSTQAACRTWNILAFDGRPAIAALIFTGGDKTRGD